MAEHDFHSPRVEPDEQFLRVMPSTTWLIELDNGERYVHVTAPDLPEATVISMFRRFAPRSEGRQFIVRNLSLGGPLLLADKSCQPAHGQLYFGDARVVNQDGIVSVGSPNPFAERAVEKMKENIREGRIVADLARDAKRR